jgi:Predicted membrane protein
MSLQHYITAAGHQKRIKDRLAATLLAFFSGALGIHKFYTGRTGWGVVYLLFSWTFVPFIAGIIEGILYLFMTDDEFDAKYNY